MAAGVLTRTTNSRDGVEDPAGLFGAVLRAVGAPRPVRLTDEGPVLVTTLEDSRSVLTRTDDFVLPFNVSRQRLRGDDPGSKPTPPLTRSAVELGLQVFGDELASARPAFAGPALDTLAFLRTPVARSTTAAVVPEASDSQRNDIGDLTLAWIDSLAPIISAARPPRRWSASRRSEQRSRAALVEALTTLGCAGPAARATALAAGIQVPIAAGAWCLTQLACRPDLQAGLRADPELATPYVWEILRLFPPSWMLPRVTACEVGLGDVTLSAYTAIVVSPVALGRLPELAPGPRAGCSELEEFDPARWTRADLRPGAWLPFGAGMHACPGRNLGLAQLGRLVRWATDFDLHAASPPAVNSQRGLTPDPAHIDVVRDRSS